MRTYWMPATLMLLASVAGAQTINPTTGSGPDQKKIGSTTASVTQTVNLKLPEATALHLDASQLVFDISQIDKQDGTWYCAYGLGSDERTNLGNDFWNQTQVLPLKTFYTPVAGEFGKINISAGERVTQYPPVKTGTNGELVAGSKDYFVCYRSFIIQKFSNVGGFKLSVQRDNPGAGKQGNQLMYIQDNPCDFWGDAGGTGLYDLPPGASRELIPRRMTVGTTGARAAAASQGTAATDKAAARPATCRANTSWLDDLVVVAIVVDGDRAGDNVATLTYTLTSNTSGFTTGN
ncbi:hypothetical protein L1280_002396 [Deinococcus sp. HSC-46F16]|uniref:hypothetical protein n=1 Tax=Deinococcus sp. HSC-46F16 TaxID=2910968 RepID=UPI0020A0E959|nr:hypothetical protein [Deinococcus sp. HSC-46F16]MCP2015235.1 hypothetical protein [Deinococcus sp. HSC-46F16]